MGCLCQCRHTSVSNSLSFRGIDDMAKEEERYDTEEALGKFLEQVDKDYTQYSEELFKQGVRKKSQIAHASVDLLERYGVLPIHGSDLKAKCQVPGDTIAFACVRLTKVRSA